MGNRLQAVKPKNKGMNTTTKVIIISPPFYSHSQPLLALGEAFRDAGLETVVACDPSFEDAIKERSLRFVELTISRNANIGSAGTTRQSLEEQKRLDAFLDATRAGAIETLVLQARHRKADMLFDPYALREQIADIATQEQPDLWIVDQLSYGVTLALHSLKLRFITFNPGHPRYIPAVEDLFGVPTRWPEAFFPDAADLEHLRRLCREVERKFTAEFNRFLRAVAPDVPPVPNAFGLSSPEVILYNYPELPTLPHRSTASTQPNSKSAVPQSIYLGSCFRLPGQKTEDRQLVAPQKDFDPEAPTILIVMGTFLAARTDVIERCILAALSEFPKAQIIAAAGSYRQELTFLASDRVRIEEFVPQTALLPHVDLVIHHGGNNTFTECIFYGKAMLILPFSSDQFNIAFDAEVAGLAEVADPNAITQQDLGKKMRASLERVPSLVYWQDWVRSRGPAYAVRELKKLL